MWDDVQDNSPFMTHRAKLAETTNRMDAPNSPTPLASPKKGAQFDWGGFDQVTCTPAVGNMLAARRFLPPICHVRSNNLYLLQPPRL